MNPVTLSDFQLIISKYGKEKGQAYFDPNESLTHDIFPDRIVFYTNFLDHRSYETYIQEEILCLKKTRLDNYELHLKATIIEDEMDEDDWEELDQLWSQMRKDLITAPILSEAEVRTELIELFSYLFTESEAETFSQKLPKKKKPDANWIWEQIASALKNTNRSVSFEWKEWVDQGVMEVNTLSPVMQSGITIPYPGKKEIQDVNKAVDWERALLQYFNAHLDAFDLKLMAIGTHFDEYQMFACLHMRDLSLVNALEKLNKLGIVYKY
jgi:hypothetical protein